MKLRRFLSCMMALLLVCGLPLSALAEEYDLAKGSITVTAKEDGQYVTQTNGVTNHKEESETVITQSNSSETSTTNSITIKAEKDAAANVTLSGVNIDVSGTGGYISSNIPGEAAVQITGNGDVTIELDGENTVQSGHWRAGVEKNTTAATETEPANGTGKLTITDENETHGSLEATGGKSGSGIGGGYDGSSSNITISGSAEVTAQGNAGGAGIGGGCGDGSSSGSNITIQGNARVTAKGGNNGSGIGGGKNGDGSNITIEGSAEVTATGGSEASGIGGGRLGSGSDITITGSAEVTANGGSGAAGIGGGGSGGNGSDITIEGSAEVTAKGGMMGAGIGGGDLGSGNGITIEGRAEVTAQGGQGGAGIGGGYNSTGKGTGSNITVSGDAQVKAQGGNYDYSNGSNETQGAGAAIGNGGHDEKGDNPVAAKGEDAVVTTDAPQEGGSYGLYVGDLNEGWVAIYAPGENMDTANPGSLTYQGGIKVPDAVPVPRKEPTCTEAGHEAGYKIGNVLVAVTIPAKGHNVPNGTPHNDATCSTLGTMEGYCTNCQTTVTVTDPNSKLKDHTFTTYTPDPDHLATCTEAGTKTAVCDVCKNETDTIPDPAKNHSMGDFSTYKEATCTEAGEERAYCKNKCGHYETKDILPQGHSFTDYVSDGNATYTSDGTKTAKCDRCDATDTLPDPGSKLVFLPGAFYKVIGKDGKALVCKETNQNGVLTITAEEDFATLTGSLSGMKTLKAHGIDTIVFVTKGATSTFAVEDLLAQGASGNSYQLTHDGSTVTFTLNDSTDIRNILK